jgi:predicted amidohydrolase YtcJ
VVPVVCTLWATLLPASGSAQTTRQATADLVFLGGKIVTVDDQRPQASALAVCGDRIAAVGNDAAVRRWVGKSTRIVELAGKLALPGFIEGHGHFVGLGESKRVLDLTRVRNWNEIVGLVQESARKTGPGNWLVGRGWHQAKWDHVPEDNVEGYPSHGDLSRVTPDHPVILTHASGHMCLANAKAMQLAGVDRNTPDPPGGTILRDRAGNPSGVFREAATGLISRARDRDQGRRTAEQIQRERDEAIRLAADECLANGVTTFHDAGESFATIDHLRRLAEHGQLPVRLWVMVGESPAAMADRLAQYRIVGLGNHHLTVRAVKSFMDGALGTHGAWLLAPYADLPGSAGLSVASPDAIRRVARLAMRYDFQLCVHAIGDRANREVLDVFTQVFKEHPERTDLRWRIEHAQHLSPEDIPRFARLGVIASMQGIHCTSDAPFVIQRLGPRRAREGAYAWRSLLDSGAVLVNGTDAPVEAVSPIQCFYASVTRKDRNAAAFFPEQRMTRPEALRTYTLNASYAAFEEHLKGSLTPGKLADITVLSADIMSCPEEDICRAQVVWTIVGGKVLFPRQIPLGRP